MVDQDTVNSVNEASTNVTAYLEQYGLRIILSIVLFVVFSKLIQLITEFLENVLKKRRIDQKIVEVTVSFTRYILYLFLGMFITNVFHVLSSFLMSFAFAFMKYLPFSDHE